MAVMFPRLLGAVFGLVVVAAMAIALGVSPAVAFDPADVKKLKATKSCFKCDLSGANLRRADLTNARLTGRDPEASEPDGHKPDERDPDGR